MKSKVIAILSSWLGKSVSLVEKTKGKVFRSEGIGILVLKRKF